MDKSELINSVFRAHYINFYSTETGEYSNRKLYDGFFKIINIFDIDHQTTVLCENVAYAPGMRYNETFLINYTYFNFNMIYGGITFYSNKIDPGHKYYQT